jgi:hypothetical protein
MHAEISRPGCTVAVWTFGLLIPLSDSVVTLRPWTLDDVPAIAAACADAGQNRRVDYAVFSLLPGDTR